MSDKLLQDIQAEITVLEGQLLSLKGHCLSPDARVVEVAARRRQPLERELAKFKEMAGRQGELRLVPADAA